MNTPPLLRSRLTYAERAATTAEHVINIANYRTLHECRAANIPPYCDHCLNATGFRHYTLPATLMFRRHYQQILWKKNIMTYQELFSPKTTAELEAELNSLQAFLNDGGSSVSVADMRMEDALTQELARRRSGDETPHDDTDDTDDTDDIS